MLPGGMTLQPEPAENQHQQLVDAVRSAIEVKANQNFKMFKAVSYHRQVVAGANYAMKIQVSDAPDGFVHAKIFQPLPQTGLPPRLHPEATVFFGKRRDDPIEK